MISDDCLLVPGAVKKGVDLFEKYVSDGRKIGAMAFYWRNWPDQKDYSVGLTLGNKMTVNHGLYLRSALEQIDWIDEEYGFYYADGDLCLRLWQKGFEVVDGPDSYVEHFTHANAAVRKSNLSFEREDWQKYINRWTGIFYDPLLNNVGAWQYRSFSDPHQTFQDFPIQAVRISKRVNIEKNIRGKLGNIKRAIKCFFRKSFRRDLPC